MKKNFILLLAVIAIFLTFANSINAQKVVLDDKGNYRSVTVSKVTKDTVATEASLTANATNTGKVYVDSKGNTYKVWQSKSGAIFVVRKSKKGNWYRSYLKVETTR